MNLYIETLSSYLINEWSRSSSTGSEKKEARFIIQSLGPVDTFTLFEILEQQRIKLLKKIKVKCYFKVANALWNEWKRDFSISGLDEMMDELGGINNGKREWIDEDDKLTWFRSRTVESEREDALLIVLVGLNHATDQGGLKDFHIIDENRIWRAMDKSFSLWVEIVNSKLDLNATDLQKDKLDKFLEQVFKLRPMRLSQFGAFIDNEIIKNKEFTDIKDILDFLLSRLPYWGIPPILTVDDKILSKLDSNIKFADEFISHKRYKTRSSQNKDWEKISLYLNRNDFELPNFIGKVNQYKTKNDFENTLRLFIFEADTEARSRLLKTDIIPVLNALNQKEKSKSASRSMPSFNTISLEALLNGVWSTLEKAKNEKKISYLNPIHSINIVIETFQHDLIDDEYSGEGREKLAKDLLVGCLGGIDKVFEDLDCIAPADQDQATQRRMAWTANIPIKLDFDAENVEYTVSRAHPRVRFKVIIFFEDENQFFQSYNWLLGPNHPERVRYECGKNVLEQWSKLGDSSRALLTFRIPSIRMAALYFAADEEEANRLLTHAMADIKLVNLLDGLSASHVDSELWGQTIELITAYQDWLKSAINEGFYEACRIYIPALISSYIELSKNTLDSSRLGSTELLTRLYKAFLIIDENIELDRPYLPSAIVWGLSPAMLELSQANIRFLADGFSEVLGSFIANQASKALFSRLIDLGKIQRPLTALVTTPNKLSARVKSFGLVHYLGSEPSTDKSLAIQTMLREEESDDDSNVSEFIRSCEEKILVERVIRDYQQLYPVAEDGLRILAVNVKDLSEILSGIDAFLQVYLKECSPEWPPFNCTLTVYSRSSSPMAVESQLKKWRDYVFLNQQSMESKVRPLNLTIGHRYAPFESIEELLSKESQLYDIAFLFHFLRDGLAGKTEPALSFEYDFKGWRGLQFPISEYPRPIRQSRMFSRESLLSNRRLQIQTTHADLSARLCYSGSSDREHLIIGEVDYRPWAPIIQNLHGCSHWVACIDPFIDKGLIASHDPSDQRKIVGFSSGLGAYGELNITLSTEQDTLKKLIEVVRSKLINLLPHNDTDLFEQTAAKIVNEAEQIIGLASLRAVVGIDEKIREVVGFAAIQRSLACEEHVISQLIPIDSLLHWYVDSEVSKRPDLLHLTLKVREGDVPLVNATLIECKLAHKNAGHLQKAFDQVQDGIRHLTGLLAPECYELDRVGFDRRYWWAQLHRAIVSRAVVNITDKDSDDLKLALERLTLGQFEINWKGMIFTFWTDVAGIKPIITSISVDKDIVKPPFIVPDNFHIKHVEFGYDGLINLFNEDQVSRIKMDDVTVSLRTEKSNDIPVDVSLPEGETSISLSQVLEFEGDSILEPLLPILDVDSTNEKASTVGSDLEEIDVKESEVVEVETIANEIIASGKNDELLHESSHALQSLAVPEKLFIGRRNNGEPVYWYYGHPKLANRHLLLFGTSGSGKTYGIQCLLAEMAQQNLHSLIIDYTNGFMPSQMEKGFIQYAQPKNHIVITDKLPLNPFHKQQLILDPSIPPIEEKNYQVATRIQSIISSVFDLGEQQAAALVRAIEAGLDQDPNFGLNSLLDFLRNEGSSGESLANKLEPFVKAEPFCESNVSAWKGMLESNEHMVSILQLAGLAREIQKIVTEFTLWDLWDFAQNNGSKQRPIPIVLDEIQNLDHSSDSPIDKMLREGRKFGLSLILATQTMSQFDKEQQDRLFQAGHKLFFKPATTEIDRFAKIIAQSRGENIADWKVRLSKLEKGQCWSLGPVERSDGSFREDAVLLSVTAFEERFK